MALRKLSLLALPILFVGGCGEPVGDRAVPQSQSPSAPRELTLRLKASKGDKYTMVMEMDTQFAILSPAGGEPETRSLKMAVAKEHTCIDVTDGKMRWQMKTVDVTGSGTGPFEAHVNETVEAEKKRAPTVAVLDDRNRVIESSENNPFPLTFPDGPVKVGDSWQAQSKVLDQDLNVTYKLDKFEKLDGKDAAAISANFTGNEKLKVIKPLLVYVDTLNGWPIKGEGEFEMASGGIKAKLIAKFSVK